MPQFEYVFLEATSIKRDFLLDVLHDLPQAIDRSFGVEGEKRRLLKELVDKELAEACAYSPKSCIVDLNSVRDNLWIGSFGNAAEVPVLEFRVVNTLVLLIMSYLISE